MVITNVIGDPIFNPTSKNNFHLIIIQIQSNLTMVIITESVVVTNGNESVVVTNGSDGCVNNGSGGVLILSGLSYIVGCYNNNNGNTKWW